MRHLASTWAQGLADLLWPPRCLACDGPAWDHRQLCVVCAARVPAPAPRCARCGRITGPHAAQAPCARCRDEDLGLDGVIAAWSYYGLPRELVIALKYRRQLPAAGLLVQAVAEVLEEASCPGDLIVPVPLSRRRFRTRGFNQAEILARGLAAVTGLDLSTAALVRQRHTPPQVGQPRGRRRRGPRGAFRASAHHANGRSILLVDDVLTTGGTARACAIALRRARARSVVAVVACRA